MAQNEMKAKPALPERVRSMEGLGINLANAVPHPVTTAGGTTTFQRLRNVTVEIEGQSVTVDVLFDPTNQAPPLAGRGVLLAAFELGFQPTNWLWV